MRVIIASTVVPFIRGGGTLIVDWLEESLRDHGHEVEVLRLPFHDWYPEMPARMAGLRLFEVADHGDRLIAIRYPAHLLRHPQKVVWFIHHYRAAFDLWGTKYAAVPDDAVGVRYRELFRAADNRGLGEAKRLFSNSRVVAERIKRFNGLEAEVLYPPLGRPERFHTDGYEDFVFFPSRLTPHKRQWLAVKSLVHVKTPVRLVLAGQPDVPGYEDELRGLAHELGVEDRITIRPQWISEEEKVEFLARCLAVMYPPLDEDSYGYPSLEAHHSGKCVITTSDAGGTLELIQDGVNGFVTDPDPPALAARLDELYEDRERARAMGEAGQERMQELGIAWSSVIARLLA